MTAAPYQAGAVPISGLPALPGVSLASQDELAIVDVSASETKKIAAEAFLQGALNLLPAGSINGNLIYYPETPVLDVNASIPDGSITAVKLADNSSAIFATVLPASGSFVGQICVLSDGSTYVWTGSAWLGAAGRTDQVTADDLADNSSAVWLNANEAPASDGNFVGQIAIDNNGQAYVWNATEWFTLTCDVADKSITAAKLADSSSAVFYTEGESSIQGEFIGQLAIDDVDGMAYAWTGTAWLGLTSPTSLTGSTGDLISIEIDTENGNAITGSLVDTTGAGQFLAGPADSGGAVSYRTIVNSDLPLADVDIPGAATAGPGLSVSGGVIDLPTSITANDLVYHVVTYNEYGLITAGASLDEVVIIPPATTTSLGGIIVGSGLAVDDDGLLSVDFSSNTDIPFASTSTGGIVIVGGGLAINESGVLSIDNTTTAGTFSKVTIDAYGLVTQGDFLTDADIPALDASKITTGFIDSARIGDATVRRSHLADYSVTFIQETAPTLNVGAIGGLWLKESTGALSVFNGNRWVSVSGSGGSGGGTGGSDPTLGLRYGGVVDGTTGTITSVTTEGASAGFTVSTALAGLVTSDNEGVYFVVNPAGDQIGVIPGQATSVGDWVLAASIDTGWSWVDRSGGGGGGTDPSTIQLNELADVAADSPVDGDCLIYNGTNGVYDTRKVNITEIGDVSVNSPTDNQILTYSGGSWINAAAPSGGGVIQTDAPSDGKQYARQNEAWSEIVIPEAPEGETVQVSETPPASPTVGMVWLRPSTLRQYVYMTDEGGSSQWASVMCC